MQINMDVKESQIKDDAEKIVDLEQDEDRKRADEDVICSDLSGNTNILTHVYLTGHCIHIQKKWYLTLIL